VCNTTTEIHCILGAAKRKVPSKLPRFSSRNQPGGRFYLMPTI
jgi:hypothetical protein